ncbi:MAG: NAD(P)/FAD-dependent oxidoreductase [Acidobacteria bacterium]|nr:NAD(P)/FAD-dependent oxidoreductase [Acidobacteriota bacterium]
MSGAKTILILGGGVGGLVTAVSLRKKLPSAHRIILVDRKREHLFQPSLLWILTGARRAGQIIRPLARLKRKGIEVLHGTVESIDPGGRRVSIEGIQIQADALVIALGAELALDAIPGLAEAGHAFYSLAGAEGLRQAFQRLESGRLAILTAAPAYKCPAAPYEAAMLLEADLRRRGLRDQVQIDFHAAEPGPMGVAGPEVSKAVRGLVEAKGIAYHPEHQIASVEPATKTLRFTDGTEATFDLLAYVPTHRAPKVAREAGLVNEAGWIPVDRHTLQTRFEGVYAIGDVTTIPLKMGKPLPKAGVFAHGQAEVVARNLALAILGHGSPAAFQGHGECFVETGDGRAALGRGNFYGEPTPQVAMRAPGILWHWAKVWFEKFWLWRWF